VATLPQTRFDYCGQKVRCCRS